VDNFGALKEPYGVWHLATGCRRQMQKRTQGDGGPWKKLAAAHRGMAHHAIPALCKGHGHQGPGRDNIVRGAPKGWTLERRQQMYQECSNGIRD
jgi:hypothetical protein